MKFKVFSQREAESIKYSANCLVISITGDKNEKANITHTNLLRLKFHDIDRKGNDNWTLFDNSLAKTLLSYVNNNIKGVDTIIVHCHAGISRSPAVASALSYILNGTDYDLIKRYGLYNRRVYSTIVREFQENYDSYKLMTEFLNLKLKSTSNKELRGE